MNYIIMCVMIYININIRLSMKYSSFTNDYKKLLEFMNGPIDSPLVHRRVRFKDHLRLHFKSEEDKTEFVLKYM